MTSAHIHNALFSSTRGLGVSPQSCSYANLPECVAQTAAEGEMFLVLNDGYINVIEAQKEIDRVHTCLTEAEMRLTSLSQISRDLVIDSGVGFLIKRAGWNWRR